MKSSDVCAHIWDADTSSKNYSGDAQWTQGALIQFFENSENDNYAMEGIMLMDAPKQHQLGEYVSSDVQIHGEQYSAAIMTLDFKDEANRASFEEEMESKKYETQIICIRSWGNADKGRKANLKTQLYWAVLLDPARGEYAVFAMGEAGMTQKRNAKKPTWTDCKVGGSKSKESPSGRVASLKSAAFSPPGLGNGGDDIMTNLCEVG